MSVIPNTFKAFLRQQYPGVLVGDEDERNYYFINWVSNLTPKELIDYADDWMESMLFVEFQTFIKDL